MFVSTLIIKTNTMTKISNLATVFTLLVIFLTSISCVTENDELTPNSEKSFTYTSVKNSTISYNENYKINPLTSTIDFENGQINLEIPVPLNDYQYGKAYNISSDNQTAILVLISRNSTENVSNLPVSYLINTNISFDEVNLNTNALSNSNNINIFVMNRNHNFNDNSPIIEFMKEHNTINSKDPIFNTVFNTKSDASADGPEISNDGKIIINGTTNG